MLRSVFLDAAVAARRLRDPRSCSAASSAIRVAGWLATLAVTASFVVSIVVFVGLFRLPADGRSYTQTWFTWISAGHLHVDMGLLVDPLSMTMARS